ncbi:MAG: hypothetical protein J5525_02205 [Lachnospiraceae bacterium]|nr:hypothetical protein [Lachnospiraceae bacterium]
MADISSNDKREYALIIFNVLIVIFVAIGTIVMLNNLDSATGLTSEGIENFKYFTVLSNIFCGIVALLYLIFKIKDKKIHILLKLMAASATGLTFLIIAAFLQPMYPELNLYKGGNLFFHLIVPLLAMCEFVLIKTEKIPFKYTFISAILALIYGTGYCVNILINGKGVWPNTNDWYGFLNWGWPVGLVIFAFIVIMDWMMACLLRFLNKILNRVKTEEKG